MSTVTTLWTAGRGYASPTVARFLWELDDQDRLLRDAVRGAQATELEWQCAPGMNTIGMLLAHIAYAEAHLTQVGILGEALGHAHDVIGITDEEEGLPLAPDAPPSPALAGKELAFFEDLLARARVHTRRVALPLTDMDLDRQIVRQRPDGTQRVFNVGWVFYHLVEHQAGHRAQILLLRHLHGVAARH